MKATETTSTHAAIPIEVVAQLYRYLGGQPWSEANPILVALNGLPKILPTELVVMQRRVAAEQAGLSAEQPVNAGRMKGSKAR